LGLFDAACAAVSLHAKAGDLAAAEGSKRSLIASDIIDYLPAAFRMLEAK
jgi:NAD(P)H-hydrate repair Nnr-like enzyme with NAD(P)H-hydrate dehydratase domain